METIKSIDNRRLKNMVSQSWASLERTVDACNRAEGHRDGLAWHLQRMVEVGEDGCSVQDMPGDGIVFEVGASVAPASSVITEFKRLGRKLTFSEFKKICI